MKTEPTNLRMALALAKRGLRVFPCKPNSKAPATEHGCLDASSDPNVVRRMFANKPDLNVAVATGPESGVWALDADGRAGCMALAELEVRHGSLPQRETLKVFTPGDGYHLYFLTNGVEIRNRTKVNELPIDVRGVGGYVVTSPSVHPNGGRYHFDDDMSNGDEWYPDLQIQYVKDTPIAQAPKWLVEFVTSKTSAKPAAVSSASTSTVERLATAPGAIGPHDGRPGNRHDKALELIGREIGFGTSKADVLRLALAWGARCSPPADEVEIERVVEDLAARHVAKPQADISRIVGTAERSFGDQAEAAIEEAALDAPIREPAPWPILDDDAYHGIAGEIVRTIEPETEADPAAILAQLLVSFGNLAGRDAYYVVEGTQHHTNLFAVLVGSTARGRKGTSEGRVKQILRQVDEPWVLQNIKTGCVSGEGVIWNVRDPIYKMENVKDKGRIVGTEEVLADPGISDKRLLVIEPEFAAVLRVCKRETNTLSPTLRSAWDSGILRTLAKNSPAVATDAHVSVVGHITSEELRRALTECDSFNGFANRFLWFAVRRSKLLPDGGRDLDLTRHAQRLALAADQARSVGRMYRDQAAAALWRHAYAELADDQAGGLLGAVTSRAEAQVLRLSMVYALLDGTGTISERHLRAALAVWRYCRSSAAMIFGDLAADPVETQILAKIKAAPGISRKDLHRVLGGHTKAAALNSILTRLRDTGRVRVERIETATKPAERWYPCEQYELSEQFDTVGSGPGPETGESSESSESSQHGTDNSTGTGTPVDEPEVEEYDATYCRSCRRVLTDRTATVVCEYSGDYCRECIEAGRVREPFTERVREWVEANYPIGHRLTDDTEPAVTVCNHKDPETWVVTDGKAHCPVCTKFMGRVRK